MVRRWLGWLGIALSACNTAPPRKAGWLRDAVPLVPEAGRALAGTLLDYDPPQVLRAPPARRMRYCHAGGAR